MRVDPSEPACRGRLQTTLGTNPGTPYKFFAVIIRGRIKTSMVLECIRTHKNRKPPVVLIA